MLSIPTSKNDETNNVSANEVENKVEENVAGNGSTTTAKLDSDETESDVKHDKSDALGSEA